MNIAIRMRYVIHGVRTVGNSSLRGIISRTFSVLRGAENGAPRWQTVDNGASWHSQPSTERKTSAVMADKRGLVLASDWWGAERRPDDFLRARGVRPLFRRT
jgi:hypothetical protein